VKGAVCENSFGLPLGFVHVVRPVRLPAHVPRAFWKTSLEVEPDLTSIKQNQQEHECLNPFPSLSCGGYRASMSGSRCPMSLVYYLESVTHLFI
jgi:hypothetical protein